MYDVVANNCKYINDKLVKFEVVGRNMRCTVYLTCNGSDDSIIQLSKLLVEGKTFDLKMSHRYSKWLVTIGTKRSRTVLCMPYDFVPRWNYNR